MPPIVPSQQTSIAQFARVYGREPEVCTQAPGRINLIGEHVDYQDGLVMPAAIDRYVFAAAAPITEPEVRLWSSSDGGEPLVIALERDVPLGGDRAWANYAFGVAAKYRDAGHPSRGFEIVLDSNLPLGAGLSSSAALESATALIVEALAGIELPAKERALLCQAAEHDFAGVPCGIMDQLAVNAGIAGHALKIDCRSLEITPAPLPAELAAVVVDSKVKHALADGEYAKRRADCETAAATLKLKSLRDATMEAVEDASGNLGDRVYRRARHVVSEIARVRAFTAALDGGETARAGALMAESHASLRDDYEVSCPELDALVEIANELGAVGARMMGGGFGGSTVNIVEADSSGDFAQKIAERYREKQGKEVEAFVVRPVAGACRIPPAG